MTLPIQPQISIGGDDRALFASDMHLDEQDPATAQLFLSMLHTQASSSTHLFLLGDIFEAWVGDDDPTPVAIQLGNCLRELAVQGLRVFLMRGNRDFLLDCPIPAESSDGVRTDGGTPSSFSQRCGASLLQDPTCIQLFGRMTLVSHGDSLCTDDLQYQAFRSQTREPGWQRAFLGRPLSERLSVARAMRERSESEKGAKADYLMDVNPGAVAQAMIDAQASCLIHGHTHRPARHVLAEDESLERWVLPDWDARLGLGGMLSVDAAGFRRIGSWIRNKEGA